MQFSAIKLPPVHLPLFFASLRTLSNMKIIGGNVHVWWYRLPKFWVNTINMFSHMKNTREISANVDSEVIQQYEKRKKGNVQTIINVSSGHNLTEYVARVHAVLYAASFESRHEKTYLRGFRHQAVQEQKMVRGLQCGRIFLLFSKNKGADELRDYRVTDLRLFLYMQKTYFLMTRLSCTIFSVLIVIK